jgi:hypothetical protein
MDDDDDDDSRATSRSGRPHANAFSKGLTPRLSPSLVPTVSLPHCSRVRGVRIRSAFSRPLRCRRPGATRQTVTQPLVLLLFLFPSLFCRVTRTVRARASLRVGRERCARAQRSGTTATATATRLDAQRSAANVRVSRARVFDSSSNQCAFGCVRNTYYTAVCADGVRCPVPVSASVRVRAVRGRPRIKGLSRYSVLSNRVRYSFFFFFSIDFCLAVFFLSARPRRHRRAVRDELFLRAVRKNM